MFTERQVGKTLVSRTVGTKIASDGLKGRVYEVSHADLQKDEIAYRKFRLICDEVQGKNCLTNFYDYRWLPSQTLLYWFHQEEAQSSEEDGLRSDSASQKNPQENDSDHTREIAASDMKEVVGKLIPDSIAKDIEKSCQGIYPLQDVHIRKVKVLRRPKVDGE
ncbi:RPS3A [Bugula neritina]|uniref:RPS3A n=1 Tax=Bugula neritina TaxID=10212 RepID=A0A7J7KEU5_BUGNE|nr:RPS3A [Bugula neritina]